MRRVSAHWIRYEIGCEEIIDPEECEGVEEITRRYTAALERAIRRTPEQYFWVHRRWKSKPTGGRSTSSKASCRSWWRCDSPKVDATKAAW